MLGGYIGAGPRKLLEREMVKSSFLIQNRQSSDEIPIKSNLKGAGLSPIQSGTSWLPLPS